MKMCLKLYSRRDHLYDVVQSDLWFTDFTVIKIRIEDTEIKHVKRRILITFNIKF